MRQRIFLLAVSALLVMGASLAADAWLFDCLAVVRPVGKAASTDQVVWEMQTGSGRSVRYVSWPVSGDSGSVLPGGVMIPYSGEYIPLSADTGEQN